MNKRTQTTMFVIDETHGSLYTIPTASIAWIHSVERSKIKFNVWLDNVVNTPTDSNAFTNSEMIINRSNSSSPTCILKTHDNEGFIFAQILELHNVPSKYKTYGVTNECIGGCFVWPLSYNQHQVIWTKIVQESSITSSLRSFPPVQPPLISFSDDGKFSGPETRPRPCMINGAVKTSISSELTPNERFALLVFCTSQFLYRNGKAITERHVRASRKYMDEFPMIQTMKQNLMNECNTRRQENINDIQSTVHAETFSSMIRNAPNMVTDLRMISGLPIAAATFVTTKRKEVSRNQPSYFGCCDSLLADDAQFSILKRAVMNVFANTDTKEGHIDFTSLSLTSRYVNNAVMDISHTVLTKASSRVHESLIFGAENNTCKISRWTYYFFSCSPVLLLDLYTRSTNNVVNNKHDVVRGYFMARIACGTCKNVSLVRGGTFPSLIAPMAATRCVSSLDMEEDELQKHRCIHPSKSYTRIKNLLKVLET